MATISIANFKVLADKLAKMYETARLRYASETNSTACLNYGADNISTAVLGYTDPEQTAALIQAAIDLQAATENNRIYAASGVYNFIKRLNAHVNGIDAFLTTNTARVHPYFKRMCDQIGIPISAANVFIAEKQSGEAVDDTLMSLNYFDDLDTSITITGATSATVTLGSGVTTTLFGKSNWIVDPVSATGSETTFQIIMQKLDGTSDTAKTVVMPSPSAGNIDIGTHDSDMYINAVSLTVAGATTGNTFLIRPEVERTIAL